MGSLSLGVNETLPYDDYTETRLKPGGTEIVLFFSVEQALNPGALGLQFGLCPVLSSKHLITGINYTNFKKDGVETVLKMSSTYTEPTFRTLCVRQDEKKKASKWRLA